LKTEKQTKQTDPS